MFLVAVSYNGIFYGTILSTGIEGCHPDDSFSADREPPVFASDTLQGLASRLKHGEVQGEVDGYQWNVQDREPMIWRPD